MYIEIINLHVYVLVKVVAYALPLSLPCPVMIIRVLSQFNFSLINGRGFRPKVFIFFLSLPGHGFINQTKEFTDGYVLGFCSSCRSSMDKDEQVSV